MVDIDRRNAKPLDREESPVTAKSPQIREKPQETRERLSKTVTISRVHIIVEAVEAKTDTVIDQRAPIRDLKLPFP
jgi:hypothetical protein